MNAHLLLVIQCIVDLLIKLSIQLIFDAPRDNRDRGFLWPMALLFRTYGKQWTFGSEIAIIMGKKLDSIIT